MKQFVKLIMVAFLATLSLQAQNLQVEYKVEFGIVGEIGIAKAQLTQEAQSYTIDIQLAATGISKTLSGGREEHHISKGHMENGVMVSDLYQIIKTHGSKMSNEIYRIDHKKKEVTKEKKKWKKGKLVTDETKVMEKMYAKDDLLTLYFNLGHYIKDKTKSKDYRLSAVGAEKQDGYVDIHIPNAQEMEEYHDLLGKDGSWYAQAIIHQDIFSSDKGELFLSVGEDGITKKAVLKDLIFFGDIRAQKI